MKYLLNVALTFLLTTLINTGNAFALTSNGNDGALTLNSSLTLNTTNNQVFNYTVITLEAGSTLDFSGLNSGDSVFILGTGDITLDGTINLPSFTNFTFETSGNIHIGGSVLTSNSNLSFISNSFVSDSNSSIGNLGGAVSLTADRSIQNNGSFNVIPTQHINLGDGGSLNNPSPLIPLLPVPESSSYVLFILGLLVLYFSLRKINH